MICQIGNVSNSNEYSFGEDLIRSFTLLRSRTIDVTMVPWKSPEVRETPLDRRWKNAKTFTIAATKLRVWWFQRCWIFNPSCDICDDPDFLCRVEKTSLRSITEAETAVHFAQGGLEWPPGVFLCWTNWIFCRDGGIFWSYHGNNQIWIQQIPNRLGLGIRHGIDNPLATQCSVQKKVSSLAHTRICSPSVTNCVVVPISHPQNWILATLAGQNPPEI